MGGDGSNNPARKSVPAEKYNKEAWAKRVEAKKKSDAQLKKNVKNRSDTATSNKRK